VAAQALQVGRGPDWPMGRSPNLEIAAKSQSGTLSGWGVCVRASPARASGAEGTGTVLRCLVQRVCECVCVCACCSAAPYDASSHVIITRELEHAQGFRKQTWPPQLENCGQAIEPSQEE